jgi:lysine/ornithine N-monooxygenase
MSDKYKNGKIYTIRCKNDDTLLYVGSTVQPLFKRWHQHKKNSINEKSIKYNYPLYKKIRETNIEDWYIELYEEFSCENKEQLNKREGQIIREIGTLNKRIEGRTPKEYRDSNKELISEKKKIYNKNNKEII